MNGFGGRFLSFPRQSAVDACFRYYLEEKEVAQKLGKASTDHGSCSRASTCSESSSYGEKSRLDQGLSQQPDGRHDDQCGRNAVPRGGRRREAVTLKPNCLEATEGRHVLGPRSLSGSFQYNCIGSRHKTGEGQGEEGNKRKKCNICLTRRRESIRDGLSCAHQSRRCLPVASLS